MSLDNWNANHYDGNLSFVSRHGQSLLPLLAPQPGERILDLGCGTGDLAAELARTGALCLGIDASVSMVEEACAKHAEVSGLAFEVADARSYSARESFDAVFSNAALHWVRPPEQAAAMMGRVLRPGGRIAVEFGGRGNVEAIVNAIIAALGERGVKAETPWYFPTVPEYGAILEGQGFEVRYAELYDRPTKLAGGMDGIYHWLEAFSFPFFQSFASSPEEKRAVYKDIARRAQSELYRGGEWIVDYRRLRFLAVNQG